MKLKKLVALFALAALLLSSCASGEGTYTSPESPAATAEPAAAEAQAQESPAGLTVLPMEDPMAGIDDSLSYRVEPDINSDYEAYTRSLKENFKAAYLEKLSSYFADMEIDDMSFSGNIMGTGMTGWFTFTGTPRPGSGIEPQELYCRSFNIRSESEGRTLIEFQRSWPMEPVDYLSQYPSYDGPMADSDIMFDAYREKEVSGLVEAELYVRQLDSRYILTDPEELEVLALSLSENDIGSADPASSCDNNPLYLRFEDGSSSLVLTAADGSNLCYAWGLWYAYMDSESIFQRFGVPLEAEGYETLPGGGVRTTVNDYDFRVGQRIITVEYSAQGDPVSWLTRQESSGNQPAEILRRYEYDTGRHRVKEEYLEDGELYTTTVYEYSGDLLVRMEQRLSTGGMVYETYGYDELGRLIEQNSYYPDAIGGPISSSGAFWYDDQGYRHGYKEDENGNLVGYEDQPIRKPQD